MCIEHRLAAIMARGVVLRIEGGKLYARDDGGALTADDRAWIAANKPAIIRALVRLGWEAPTTCHAPAACQKLGPCSFYVPGIPCDHAAWKRAA
jgi:hypothetical protein